jgi:hypothetical protein
MNGAGDVNSSGRMSGRSQSASSASTAATLQTVAEVPAGTHRLFRTIWYGINILLIVSCFALLWSSAWEYSTRRYLKGFSDAIVPVSSSPTQKIQAILDWMSHTPARIGQAPDSLDDDRNPTVTLNYASLLRVCGTATNAFVNLADSVGLKARRLLLLDANRSTVHVVAEVLVDGRWIVVDPAFRTILRAPDGSMLSRDDLAKPAVFAAATHSISGYDPSYVFDRAVHIRLARFGLPGRILRRALDASLPNWEGSPAMSLVVERESLGLTIVFMAIVILLILLRTGFRWYGESRLGVRPIRVRTKLRRLGRILLEPAD